MMSENKYEILAEQECVPGWENKIHMSIIIIFFATTNIFLSITEHDAIQKGSVQCTVGSGIT